MIIGSVLCTLAPSTYASFPIPPAPTFNAKSWVLLDGRTGQMLAQHDATQHLAPASLTKLMVAYITFAALKAGAIHPDERFTISTTAWRTGGSRMFLLPGSHVTVNDLLKGLIVDSGNDAAVALSQAVAGTRAAMVTLMNRYVHKLGLNNTHYEDVDGLPVPDHYSSALDIARLSRDIIRTFPAEYHRYFAIKSFTWDHITQENRVSLLWMDSWVDGIKTGYTDQAGYCMDASGVQNGMRLIAVVMGAPSWDARVNDAQALLDWGFNFFHDHELYRKGVPLGKVRVAMGTRGSVPLGLAHSLWVTVPRLDYRSLKAVLVVPKHLKAPVGTTHPVGTLRVMLRHRLLLTRPLYPLAPVKRGNWFEQLMDAIGQLF
jgi:D-alanyl-D-alanine carboxypeptidase (penicillin-binding protein 5/6)